MRGKTCLHGFNRDLRAWKFILRCCSVCQLFDIRSRCSGGGRRWSVGFHFVHHGTGNPPFFRLSPYFDEFVHVYSKVTTVSQRSVLMGIFGAIFAIASIGGPLLGGLFAGMPPFSPIVLRLHILKDKASWRWVNVPSYLTRLDTYVSSSVLIEDSWCFCESIFCLAIYLLYLAPTDINLPVRGSKYSLSSKFNHTGLDRWHSTCRGLVGAPLCSCACGKRDVNTT